MYSKFVQVNRPVRIGNLAFVYQPRMTSNQPHNGSGNDSIAKPVNVTVTATDTQSRHKYVVPGKRPATNGSIFNTFQQYKQFADCPFSDALKTNLRNNNYDTLTDIQQQAIPPGLDRKDIMASSQTGSGKTLAFLMVIIYHLEMMVKKSTSNRISAPKALILAPTRELCVQIAAECRKFCAHTDICLVEVYGGADRKVQLQNLRAGSDIIVATPGRLTDFINRNQVILKDVRVLVLDEADRMLDMGFEPQIREIVNKLPQNTIPPRQTLMFSATFPPTIQRIARAFLQPSHVRIKIGIVGGACKDVIQSFSFKESFCEKTKYLKTYLDALRHPGLVVVFVSTKKDLNKLNDSLRRDHYPSTCLHGDMDQRAREGALHVFRTKQTPILVATDVAARGLDVEGVTQVINFDMPTNINDYVHRIGRTGRAGAVGHAMSMINHKNRIIVDDLKELLTKGHQSIPSWLTAMKSGSSCGGDTNHGSSSSACYSSDTIDNVCRPLPRYESSGTDSWDD